MNAIERTLAHHLDTAIAADQARIAALEEAIWRYRALSLAVSERLRLRRRADPIQLDYQLGQRRVREEVALADLHEFDAQMVPLLQGAGCRVQGSEPRTLNPAPRTPDPVYTPLRWVSITCPGEE